MGFKLKIYQTISAFCRARKATRWRSHEIELPTTLPGEEDDHYLLSLQYAICTSVPMKTGKSAIDGLLFQSNLPYTHRGATEKENNNNKSETVELFRKCA